MVINQQGNQYYLDEGYVFNSIVVSAIIPSLLLLQHCSPIVDCQLDLHDLGVGRLLQG